MALLLIAAHSLCLFFSGGCSVLHAVYVIAARAIRWQVVEMPGSGYGMECYCLNCLVCMTADEAGTALNLFLCGFYVKDMG